MRPPTSLLIAVTAFGALVVSACTAPGGGPPPPDYTRCPTAAAGQAQVAVVVEPSPAATRVVCVVVADGATGLVALNARATRIGTAPPRVEGGFVCGIDGVPAAPECSPSTPEGFRYWNYWSGGTTWQSAVVGAGSRVLTQGDVDGWVFGTWDFVTTFPGAPTTASDFAGLTN